ncbi:UDP-2,4-diacetamido-2,4,6-trideoxy-beta-L-altropyranose hydrolase [Shewanella kaireitica]|uniref:UDP-2,4-diacetamido-2,4, 6-trideoxy-beta-L-altropyranose hydrolase n=1 Tax=Shewanella kaireitica TaxID=212021 RepID=UPI00200C2B98|nr:UDP-2,4-diacetamido-2,4,6-trideoxy-beta-L-altropyranose hydrolase [Shewanella kaireitica]MCL1093798.1 UDP-2,4-diacetamido-2,4,6-trideoxy-beta-L-altropyranose hydrolase [Shewanella kaireitica]
MLTIAIRVDSSHQIGIGHVMRCLTLAQEINQQTCARIVFISRESEGSIAAKIVDEGFEYFELSSGIDNASSHLQHGQWLRNSQEKDASEFQAILNYNGINGLDLVIVDHYGIDQHWHKLVRQFSSKIFAIDDLGDRYLDCEYLLDQTFGCNPEKYSALVKPDCTLFLGTKYALLRPEFQKVQPAQTNDRTLLLMFGGTDPDNLTVQALNIVSQMASVNKIIVVMNGTAKHLHAVTEYCLLNKNISLHVSPKNIAGLMQQANLAVGAAGTTSWERCAAGLPAVVIIQAINQREIAFNLSGAGVISYMEAESVTDDLQHQIEAWFKLLSSDNDIVEKCQKICDGTGTSKVVKAMINDRKYYCFSG